VGSAYQAPGHGSKPTSIGRTWPASLLCLACLRFDAWITCWWFALARHDDWPFAGNCGCSPIRIVMERSRAQQLTTVAGADSLESGPTSGASFATGRTISTAAKTLAVPVWLIQFQRMLHTVTLQFSLLALWLVTVTISLVVVVSGCMMETRLWLR